MDSELLEILLALVVFVVGPLLRKLFGKPDGEPAPVDLDDWPDDEREPPAPPVAATSPGRVAGAASEPGARDALVAWFDAMARRAEQLGEDVRVSRATARFAQALDHTVAQRARVLRHEVAVGSRDVALEHARAARELAVVLEQLETFVAQRRDPSLLPRLGDADALAVRCYEPVIEFARAENIRLRSAVPVTELGNYDLATWTAFIPTGFAPIFLPSGFFSRVAWWPAVAHEIAHDFLFAAEGVEQGLRNELGLPSEDVGTRPLSFTGDGLTMQELRRVYGGWFEEIFADVFGVLMLGPAYAHSMVTLFAQPTTPHQVTLVASDRDGRHGVHPPRHLRVVIATRVLELIGQEDDAARIRDAWSIEHGGWPDRIVFPVSGQLVGVPIEPLESLAVELADKLYGQPFRALAGFRLADVPGVDFGPAGNAAAERAAQALLAQRPPDTGDARAIVAGAVLAALREPAREQDILQLARRAIVADGTTESRPGEYAPLPAPRMRDERRAALREAFVLHTVLSPSPVMRRLGLGTRSRALFGRP